MIVIHEETWEHSNGESPVKEVVRPPLKWDNESMKPPR